MFCSKCDTDKPESDFRRGSRQCRACTAEYMREYAERNRERLNEYKAQWAKDNPDKATAACRKWRESNREFEKKRASRNRAANPDLVSRYNQERRHTEAQQTPRSLSLEDRQEMDRCYEVSATYRQFFELDTHVDHIIPLRGDGVCGLHVPWNLRITTASDNRRKHIKWSESDAIASGRSFEDATR